MAALNCSSEVSGDYYGLGVRLGIYLVWLTSYLANQFVPDEVGGAQDANAIFLLALMASIFRGTILHGDDQLRFIDGLILMQLCAGYVFGCFSLWGYRTVLYEREGRAGVRHFGGYGTHARLTLATAISAYGIWFWTVGVEDGLSPLIDDGKKKEECYPLVTFFFGKLDVLGPIRGFYIFISIACTAYYGIMLFVAVTHRLLRIFGNRRFIYETGLSVRELHYVYIFCRAGNLLWIIFSVIMVEMTVIWNHVTDVVGTGGAVAYPAQLLPLLIGALGFIRIVYLIWRNSHPRLQDEEEGSAQSAPILQTVGVEKPPAAAEENHSNESNDSRKLWVRYLVAWLPWLSMNSRWANSARPNKKRDDNTHVGQSPHDSMRPLMASTPATPSFPDAPVALVNEVNSEKASQLVSYSPSIPDPKVY